MPGSTTKKGLPYPLGNETADGASVIQTLAEAADQKLARDPFVLQSTTYNSTNNRIVCILGPGRGRLNAGLVTKTADSTYEITAPSVNTTYYLYLKSDGTFFHNTTGVYIAGHILLHQVATGTTLSTITTADMRGEIAEIADYTPASKATTDAHVAAAAPHSGHETPAGAQAKVNAHATRTDNPHAVTAAQVGAINRAGDRMTGPLEFGDANAQVRRSGDKISLRSSNDRAILEGKYATDLAQNAYHDGSYWMRFDTAQPAVIIDLAGGGAVIYTAPAGANPITWSGPYTIYHADNHNIKAYGTTTFTDAIAAGATLTKNIPLGSSYRVGKAIVGSGAYDYYGVQTFFSTDNTKTSANGTAFYDTNTRPLAWNRRRLGKVTQRYTGTGTCVGGYVTGHPDININDMYISGSNLVNVYYNANAGVQSLNTIIDWEVEL